MRVTDRCVVCLGLPGSNRLFIEVRSFGVLWSDGVVNSQPSGFIHLSCLTTDPPPPRS